MTAFASQGRLCTIKKDIFFEISCTCQSSLLRRTLTSACKNKPFNQQYLFKEYLFSDIIKSGKSKGVYFGTTNEPHGERLLPMGFFLFRASHG